MKTIKANPDSFDYSSDVKVAGVPGACYAFVASTHPKYKDWEGQPNEAYGYLNQRAACLKSHYTDEDRVNQERFNALEPIRNGEHVMVDGVECIVKVNGNYSDAATLTPVKA